MHNTFRTMDLFVIGIFSLVTICLASSDEIHTYGMSKTTFGAKDDSKDNLSSSKTVHKHGNIVKRSSGPSMVYIAMYKYDLTPGKPISVTVDSTMTKLFFKAEANSSKPVLMVTNSLGLPVLPNLNGYVVTVEGNISAADFGKQWTFTRMDRAIWDVTIMCESTLDFNYQLIDNLTGATWKENPVIGKTYKIIVSVPNYSLLKQLAMVMLCSRERSFPFDMRPVKDNGGGQYEFLYTMTNQSFMIGIDGRDSSNTRLQRLLPDLITPFDLKLIVPPYTGVFLYANKTFTINVTVLNLASKPQDLDVRIVDDKNFAQPPVFLSPTVKAGENWTGQFVLKGGRMGETTNVTITARPYFGNRQFGSGPSEVRQFTVYTNLTTTTTSTNTTTTTASTTSKPSSIKASVPSAQSSGVVASSQSISTTQAHKSSVSITSLSQKSTSGAGSSQPTVSSGSLSVGVGSSTAGAGGNGPISASAQSGANPLNTQASASSTFANVQPSNLPTTTPKSAMATNFPVAGGSKPVTSSLASSLSPIAVTATQRIVAGIETGTIKTTDRSLLSGNSGQSSTESSSSDNVFNKGDVLTAAIAAGIAGGVLVGIVGMIVMGLLFKGAMNNANLSHVKPKHEPDRVRNESFRRNRVEDQTFAWT